jgi:hypothetical protein
MRAGSGVRANHYRILNGLLLDSAIFTLGVPVYGKLTQPPVFPRSPAIELIPASFSCET